jgi:hypothetical protein
MRELTGLTGGTASDVLYVPNGGNVRSQLFVLACATLQFKKVHIKLSENSAKVVAKQRWFVNGSFVPRLR